MPVASFQSSLKMLKKQYLTLDQLANTVKGDPSFDFAQTCPAAKNANKFHNGRSAIEQQPNTDSDSTNFQRSFYPPYPGLFFALSLSHSLSSNERRWIMYCRKSLPIPSFLKRTSACVPSR